MGLENAQYQINNGLNIHIRSDFTSNVLSSTIIVSGNTLA